MERSSFFQSGGRQISETRLEGKSSSAADQEDSDSGAWNVSSVATTAALDARQVEQLMPRQCCGP